MKSKSRVLLAVIAGYFLIMFAVSPVAVALPVLAEELGLGVEAASWVMTAYLLPLTACLLPAGRLGDILGHRRVFGAGLVLAVAGAFGAGLAPGYAGLLAARALQGVGAALVSAASLPIVTATVEAARRGRSIGLATMAASLGSMAGLALAPVLLEYLNWRWAFYSSGFAGVLALALAARMAGDPQPRARARLDWPGAFLLLLALSAASLSLNHFHDGPETFADGWRWHVPMHVATAALLGMFVVVERRVRTPLIRLDQLRNVAFTTAIAANGILHMTMMVAVFSVPFLLQRGLGLTAADTSVLLVTMQASTTTTTLLGGWLYDRTRSPWPSAVALSMVASGLLALGFLAGGLTYGTCFAAIVWMGTGSGIFMTANNTRIMSALAPAHRGFASGMLETTRQYGHTLGVAVATVGLGAALGSGAAGVVDSATVRLGFGQSALLMSAIAWAGVGLAAWPMLAARRRGTGHPPSAHPSATPALAPVATQGL